MLELQLMTTTTAVPGADVSPAGDGRLSRREEARRDKIAEAEIARQDRAARLEEQRARFEMAEAGRAARARERLDAKADKRAARAAVLRALAQRAGEHQVDLMLAPLIGVPGWLGWDAMSTFGTQLYGAPGKTLPVLSETGMWIFSLAIARARARDKNAALWPLYAGMVFFALICVTLNFLHGLNGPVPGTVPPGPGAGAVYAVVSVSGLIAHQIVAAFGRANKPARGATKAPPGRATRGATGGATGPARDGATSMAQVGAEGYRAGAADRGPDTQAGTGDDSAGVIRLGPGELPKPGRTRQVMRQYWDRKLADGIIPSGADLNRAAGKDPKYSLGKRYAGEWRAGLTANAPADEAGTGPGP